jgi:hypothetical protein
LNAFLSFCEARVQLLGNLLQFGKLRAKLGMSLLLVRQIAPDLVAELDIGGGSGRGCASRRRVRR